MSTSLPAPLLRRVRCPARCARLPVALHSQLQHNYIHFSCDYSPFILAPRARPQPWTFPSCLPPFRLRFPAGSAILPGPLDFRSHYILTCGTPPLTSHRVLLHSRCFAFRFSGLISSPLHYLLIFGSSAAASAASSIHTAPFSSHLGVVHFLAYYSFIRSLPGPRFPVHSPSRVRTFPVLFPSGIRPLPGLLFAHSFMLSLSFYLLTVL